MKSFEEILKNPRLWGYEATPFGYSAWIKLAEPVAPYGVIAKMDGSMYLYLPKRSLTFRHGMTCAL